MRYERDTWEAFIGIKYLRFNRDLVLDLVADFSDSVISKFRTFQWKIKSAVSYSNTSSDSPTRILYNISGDSVGFLLIPLNWKIRLRPFDISVSSESWCAIIVSPPAPQKHPPLFLAKSPPPLKFANCPNPPF